MITRWILLGLSLLIVAVGINVYFPKEMTQRAGRSSAFQGGYIKDPLALPSPEEIKSFTTPETVISVFPDDDLVFLTVELLYRCEPTCPGLRLEYEAAGNTNVVWGMQMYHPVFDQLNWFFIKDKGLNLYQEELRHGSIEEFFTNRPQDEYVTEKVLADYYRFPNAQARYLENMRELGNVEVIISTYEYQGQLGEWRRFGRQVDMRTAKRLADGSVNLRIRQQGEPVTVFLAKVNVDKTGTK